MTVAELIKVLQNLDPNVEIRINQNIGACTPVIEAGYVHGDDIDKSIAEYHYTLQPESLRYYKRCILITSDY